MEKLIELLNEYGKIRKYNNAEIVEWVEHTKGNLYWRYRGNTWSYMVVISKEYGFIKRLVDNDKIDLKKYVREMEKSGTYSKKYGNIKYMLLMLLAIQDNPIEFLVSILK